MTDIILTTYFMPDVMTDPFSYNSVDPSDNQPHELSLLDCPHFTHEET